MNNLNPKLSWTILSIFVIALLGLVIYFAYYFDQDTLTTSLTSIAPVTTTDEPADWKTWDDLTWNFSVKYPKDWYAFEASETLFFSNHNLHKVVTDKPKENEYILEIGRSIQEPNIDPRISFSNKKLDDFSTLKISNYEAYRLVDESDDSFVERIIIQNPDNKSRVLYFSKIVKDENNFKKANKIFDQMFSTFKFTK